MGKRPSRRVRMKRGDRREQLLDVAAAILAEDGMKALTMERLSERARISKPVVYSHFENKTALVLAVMNGFWSEVDESIEPQLVGEESFDAFIRRATAQYFDLLVGRGQAARRFIANVSEDPELETILRERELAVTARWADMLIANFGITANEATTAATLARGALQAAAVLISDEPARRPDVERMYLSMVAALTGGLPGNDT